MNRIYFSSTDSDDNDDEPKGSKPLTLREKFLKKNKCVAVAKIYPYLSM